ncbi:hypothetical protein [Ruegeria arenilitoris]|uniref:hypothetical protein n=1 Tax=Ruegeria arenilitoris TaxID=1173585 RepID=UPI00147F0A11|nr:hypothetical protein [Ruegeria arenilitoris]
MDFQATRSAMVSSKTFDEATEVLGLYLAQHGIVDRDAQTELLGFLGWVEPDEDAFAQDVRIVLASAEFAREVTTAVLWLIEREIEIRCVRLQPYDHDGRVFVDVQQIIPLPVMADYQVRVTAKKRKERHARSDTLGRTNYDLVLGGQNRRAGWSS